MGIDPGSRKAGFGIIEIEGRRVKYLDSGAMKYDGEKVFMNRLGHIYDSCKELIEKYQPDYISIESLIYVKNVTSLAKLSQARGAMIAAFMDTHKDKVFEYAPNLVKSSVTGYGHSGKEGIEKTLGMIFGEKIKYQTDDESDALAIAICHFLNHGKVNIKSTGAKGGRSLKSAFSHLV